MALTQMHGIPRAGGPCRRRHQNSRQVSKSSYAATWIDGRWHRTVQRNGAISAGHVEHSSIACAVDSGCLG
jgi:hypothetical protein